MLQCKYMLHDIRPIGYWLKHLDTLIELTFERTLQAEHLSRRHWQILNVVAAGDVDGAGVRHALAPFEVGNEIDELATRGWLANMAGRFELTESGRTAHNRLLAQVQTARQRMVRDVSEDEYRGVVSTLQRMASNLSG
jgi:hypothetical protein